MESSLIPQLSEGGWENRLEGTAATVAISIARGVDIVRVHDVSQMKRVCTMTDSITRSWRPENWTNP